MDCWDIARYTERHFYYYHSSFGAISPSRSVQMSPALFCTFCTWCSLCVYVCLAHRWPVQKWLNQWRQYLQDGGHLDLGGSPDLFIGSWQFKGVLHGSYSSWQAMAHPLFGLCGPYLSLARPLLSPAKSYILHYCSLTWPFWRLHFHRHQKWHSTLCHFLCTHYPCLWTVFHIIFFAHLEPDVL